MSDHIGIPELFRRNDTIVHELSKQIPKSDDVTLVVIKGHLVVENCLYKIFSTHIKNHKYLDDAKLSFIQLLNLVKAISSVPFHQETFEQIKKLNTLRNHLAHNLTNEQTGKKVNDFIESVGIHVQGHTNPAQMIWDQIYGMLGAISLLISVEELISSGVEKNMLHEILVRLKDDSSNKKT